MNVTVKLFASFRITLGQETVITCRPGTTILDVISAFSIPDNESFIIELNGIHASLNDSLHEGDVLSLMPLIGGD
jgi:molybdopterin converting factor small subunit